MRNRNSICLWMLVVALAVAPLSGAPVDLSETFKITGRLQSVQKSETGVRICSIFGKSIPKSGKVIGPGVNVVEPALINVLSCADQDFPAGVAHKVFFGDGFVFLGGNNVFIKKEIYQSWKKEHDAVQEEPGAENPAE